MPLSDICEPNGNRKWMMPSKAFGQTLSIHLKERRLKQSPSLLSNHSANSHGLSASVAAPLNNSTGEQQE